MKKLSLVLVAASTLVAFPAFAGEEIRLTEMETAQPYEADEAAFCSAFADLIVNNMDLGAAVPVSTKTKRMVALVSMALIKNDRGGWADETIAGAETLRRCYATIAQQ